MTVSPMLRTGATQELSDTRNNNKFGKKFPFAPLRRSRGPQCSDGGWLRRRRGCASQCGGRSNKNRRQTREQRQQQMLEDERLAMQMQQEMEARQKLQAIEQRNQARRRKYKQFLAPYTMTVTESDLYTASEAGTSNASKSGCGCSCSSNNGNANEECLEDKVVETHPNHPEQVPSLVCMPISSLSDTPQEQMLRHPFNKSGSTFADVESSCSICLLDYEEGDRVVFSTRSVCRHAFHEDCILKWLENGKKRCPICRNFFVPGTPMDNKATIEHHEDDVYAIRNIPGANQDNMNNDPTDIKKCLDDKESHVDKPPCGRSRSNSITTIATDASIDYSDSDEASL